ncbi:MAG: hypothetical protein GC183_06935 [Thiobacillus sp.]|nr:hypothetical protein [Thiobacillus sp.]
MIAAFLLPFPLRGYRAPYLWVYYRLLSSFGERMLFIASEDYVRDPQHWQAQNRWELLPGNAERLQYRVPMREHMDAHAYGFLDDAVFETLLAQSGGNPLAAFRRLLSERVPCLDAAFAEILARPSAKGIEAILTWCNCPSLKAAAAERGIPVVHLEMGPLRLPDYRRPTAYFDFSGVNGGTESAVRSARAALGRVDVTIDELRAFFGPATPEPGIAPVLRASTGVVLQVEDDSNLIAFGRGYDNQSIIVLSHLRDATGGVLIRPHPGSLFALKENWYQIDDSPNSTAFIRRCERILTINSSVGLEAMLLDVPVTVLGDASFRFILEVTDAAERIARLAHYLFAYLIPMQSVFDLDYLRFRLSNPTEADIMVRHLDTYLDGDAWRVGRTDRAEALIRCAMGSVPL